MKLEDFLLTESINDKGIFKAIFMAGTPGAGKSFVRKKLSGGVEPRVVNSDTWTEFLHVKASEWHTFSDKIKLLTSEQLANFLNSLLPLWIDGTSSNPPNLLKRDGILRSLGYDTGMIWVNTDLETAIKRSQKREKEIGRHVDEDFIRTTWQKIEKLKPYYKSRFPYFKEVNNNDGELTDEVITKLYRSTGPFWTGKLDNPIGQGYIDKLHEIGGKYLEDLPNFDMSKVKRNLKGWFTY